MDELVRGCLVVGGAAALAVAALALTGTLTASSPIVQRPPPRPQLQGVSVPLARGFVGVLVGENKLDVSPRIEGSLDSVRVRIGQAVRRGEVLATLDSTPTRREILVSQAQLATARAEVSRACIEQAQAEERAVKAASVAAYLNSDEASAAIYTSKLAATRRQATEGLVMEQEARLNQLLAQLADCQLKAPADGVVADRILDSGAVVDRRSVVLRLVGAEVPRVRFAVPEESAQDVLPGLLVRIESVASRVAMSGRVETVAPQLDPASRTLMAEAVLDPGQSGVGSMATGAVVRVFPGRPEPQAEKLGLPSP